MTRSSKLIDIGANLAHESFDSDLDEVLEHAMAAGVSRIVVTGSDIASAQRANELSLRYPRRLYATAGLHPHHARDFNEDMLNRFAELAEQPHCVAIGETGLDFFRDISPRDLQEKAFEAHLALAARLEMPLFLHQRDAHARFLPLLKEWRDRLADVVVHCFTDSRQALFDYLDQDCHIGITGWICDERRGRNLFEDVRHIPSERLMLETDAPYLMPRTIRPRPKTRRNEPAHLSHVLATVAEARGEDAAGLARQTTNNALRFFRLESEHGSTDNTGDK